MARVTSTKPLWKIMRERTARPMAFATPEALMKECCGYFEWAEENPLKEAKLFSYQGDVITDELSKLRAWSVHGLCMYLGISTQRWTSWAAPDHPFTDVVAMVNQAIFEQKFTGAAADLLNATIIARELGLIDKSERDLRSGDGSMTPTRITREFVYPTPPGSEPEEGAEG